MMEKAYNWKREQSRLWDELVPKRGRAATLQGELIRIAGKLTDEAYRNGNENWTDETADQWRFLGRQLADPQAFTPAEIAAINEAVSTIIRDRDHPDTSGDGSPYYLLSKRAVDWCMKHPAPQALPKVEEKPPSWISRIFRRGQR
jgi:hypothetical protein